MFEEFTNQAMAILSLTIGGISVGAIIALAIYLVRAIIKNRNEIKITKQQIEDAFKAAVLPKNIKLDVSKKIQEPIKAGLSAIQIFLSERIESIEHGQRLILTILSQFNHVNRLSPKIQEEIKEYSETGVAETETL